MDRWSVTQYRSVYKSRKYLQIEIEACPVNAGHYMAYKHYILFAANLAANFSCNRFIIIPDTVFKLLRAAIGSDCAFLFKSEQTPFSLISRSFRTADLDMIQFETY